MSAIRLWIETTHHAAFRYGGWAYLREVDGAVTGYAGGERSLAAGRLELTALIAMLTSLPQGAVTVKTANASLLAVLRLVANPLSPGAEGAPSEDLDLWAQLLTAAKGRTFTLQTAPAAPQAPAAFLGAWAEVGQNKAKGVGRFSAMIPKVNVAKVVLN